MKFLTVCSILFLSFNTMASETCYQVSKQGDVLGSLCLDKDLKEVAIGESVDVKGQIENLDINFTYTRLQNQEFQSCSKPKDRPAICKQVREAWLKLPKPPLNDAGLPSVPADINFSLPDLTKGHAWNYDLSLIK